MARRSRSVTDRIAALTGLAHTSYFDRIVDVSVSTALTACGQACVVGGQVGPVTITLPALTPANAKDSYCVGVFSRDGAVVANPVSIVTPNGRTINGGASLVLSTVGAGAFLFYSRDLDEWIAVPCGGAGGSSVFLGSNSTSPNGQVITAAAGPTVLAGASLTFTTALNDVLCIFTQMLFSVAANATDVTLEILLDGVSIIKSEQQCPVGNNTMYCNIREPGLAAGAHTITWRVTTTAATITVSAGSPFFAQHMTGSTN